MFAFKLIEIETFLDTKHVLVFIWPNLEYVSNRFNDVEPACLDSRFEMLPYN